MGNHFTFPCDISTSKASKKRFLDFVPESTHPYFELIRFEKPTGTMLVFWPYVWGLSMAAQSMKIGMAEYWYKLALCLFGAFIVRSSGCTINDLCDRKLDAEVARTKSRPLPSGRISVTAATLYLLLQYAIGTAFFLKTLTGFAMQTALLQLYPITAIYPLLKRVTHWPQAWLGIAMNLGFVATWVNETGKVDTPLLVSMMSALWAWTMYYDTIYACQDMKDDKKAGVHSTALLFGNWIKLFLVAFATMFVTILAYVGKLNGQGPLFYSLSVGGTALHFAHQLLTVELDNPKSCGEIFKSNGRLGWIVWTGAFADYAIKLKLHYFLI